MKHEVLDTKIPITGFSDGRCKPSLCVIIDRLMQKEGGHTVVSMF